MSLPGGKYEYVNPASLTYTGYPPEEFYKKPGLLYELIHPSGKDAFGRQMQLLIEGKTPPAAEFQIIHRNGDVHWVILRMTLIRDASAWAYNDARCASSSAIFARGSGTFKSGRLV